MEGEIYGGDMVGKYVVREGEGWGRGMIVGMVS